MRRAQAHRETRAAKLAAPLVAASANTDAPSTSAAPSAPNSSKHDQQGSPTSSLEEWIHQRYLAEGFDANGAFKGYTWLKDHLARNGPRIDSSRIKQTVNLLRKPGHRFSFDPTGDAKALVQRNAVQKLDAVWNSNPLAQPMESTISHKQVSSSDSAVLQHHLDGNDLLAKKLTQLTLDHNINPDQLVQSHGQVTRANPLDASELLIEDTSLLLAEDSSDEEGYEVEAGIDTEIQHAPLISANLLAANDRDLVPQYGLLGSYEKEMLFLNTNIPFSAFICGVQGSGKSHTTACILENALVPSKQLGRLEKPLSALVFSYGQFSGDGSGFSISEAAFLGASNQKSSGPTHVKHINVLVSPSNYIKIAKLYLRIPNVTVSKFKLKAKNLDIDIMLTLMNVSESDDTPLYMAAVTQILRQMATEGGSFNYLTFKARLRKCRFNPAQINMLQMRLGLLESFLDLNNTCPEPQFTEGEVTIMDMSCPFVDANTACILFRIGLQRYLQSKSAGKLIVLDEAHKVRCIHGRSQH
jgi:hypothetical protein